MRQLHSGLNLSKIDGISGGASAAPNGDDMDREQQYTGSEKEILQLIFVSVILCVFDKS